MSNTRTATAKQEAQKAEAKSAFVDLEWEGKTYQVPTDVDEVDESIFDAQNEKDFVIAVIGAEQYALWRGAGRKIRELREFGEAVAKASGFSEMGK